jgi:hypothetical protein
VSASSPLHDLTRRELEAVRGAAVWYAKYQAGPIGSCADDSSAYAVAERERYLDLISALEKLGNRLRVPGPLKQRACWDPALKPRIDRLALQCEHPEDALVDAPKGLSPSKSL